MRIGVDARFLVAERTGVENYFQEVLERLILLGGPEEYLLYGSQGLEPRLPDGRWQGVEQKNPFSFVGRVGRLRRDRLDLFYSPVTAFPLAGVARRVVTVHDLAWHFVPESYSPWERFRQRRWTSLAVRMADRIVTVSESTRKDLVALFPAASERVVVISPGVGDDFFGEMPRRDEQRVRDRYGLGGRYLFTVAGFHPRKNLPNLVEAYDRFRSRSPERILLLIAGRGGRDSSRLLSRILRSPYRREILLAGYVPRLDLPALYAAAELVILPSRFEGFGIPALEAMACGTPVLVSDLPAFREICAGAALRVDPEDPDSIAEGIVRSLREEPERLERVRLGAERARAYQWEVSARNLRDVFREVVGGGA